MNLQNRLVRIIIISLYLILFLIPKYCYAHDDSYIAPVPYFVNRDNVISQLTKKLQNQKIVSLVGMTNIGKTEVARRYAAINYDKYDLIWFFDSSIDLNEQFIRLANYINAKYNLVEQDKLSENPKDVIDSVKNYLKLRNDWLLVFDNLQLNENNRLRDIVNWEHKGHVVICSQDRKGLPNLIYIHSLNKEHGLFLIKKILDSSEQYKDKKFLEEIVEIFKGYPGPIIQGAKLLKEYEYLSLDEYKNILLGSDDPLKAHIELVLNLLKSEEVELLYKISLLNNQSFSKKLLQVITNNKKNIGESLYNIDRFGLIKNTKNTSDNNYFEMHDAIKNTLWKIKDKKSLKKLLLNITENISNSIPQGVTSRYEYITNDKTFKSNLEIILENSEKYKLGISNILKLRKNLLDYYMVSLDYYNCQKIQDWVKESYNKKFLNISNLSTEDIINYAWINVDLGMYEDFAKSNFNTAFKYFDNAYELIKDINNVAELKFTILSQMAQTYAFGGDAIKSNQIIKEINNLIKKYRAADIDMGLYWFIKAKISMLEGHYNKALVAINNNIKAEAHLPQDTFTAPTYIQKSEILNYMGKFKESYKIISRIYKQEVNNQKPSHEIHARILTQLARAEQGIKELKKAKLHSEMACKVFENDAHLETSQELNTDYAAALVARADILSELNQSKQSLNFYNKAETIYFNRYGKNFGKTDDIAYLLSQGLETACRNKDNFWIKHFKKLLISNFGKDNMRAQSSMNKCKKLNL